MNAKSRGFGLLAAAILSLTMFGGAMAQNSDSEGVSTVLTGDATLCSVDIYTWGGGLGSWEFNGSSYVETSGNSTQYFLGDLYNIPAAGCNVNVAFSGLVGPGGLIGAENFSAFSYWSGSSVPPASFGANNVNPYYDFSYTLSSVPTLAAGTYSGNIVATVSNAS
jgi:hypothetical protein